MMAWKIRACQQGLRRSKKGSNSNPKLVAPEVGGSTPLNRTIPLSQ